MMIKDEENLGFGCRVWTRTAKASASLGLCTLAFILPQALGFDIFNPNHQLTHSRNRLQHVLSCHSD